MRKSPGDQIAQAQMYCERWKDLPKILTTRQKDDVGIAYLKHVIGADDRTIDLFFADDSGAKDFIGLRQSADGESTRRHNYQQFWDTIARICPQVHSAEEIEWLKQFSDIYGIWRFTSLIDYGDCSPLGLSKTLNAIKVNAHLYK